MRRLAAILIILLLAPVIASAQESDSVVEVASVVVLGSSDIGIEALAVSPTETDVLLVGIFGYAHLISTSEPIVEVELNSNDDNDLVDVDWHPAGQSALIAGDDGTVLRYIQEDHSISHVAGSTANLMGKELTSVTWDSAGNWAYIGDSSGQITRFREDGSGYSEYFPLNDTKSSSILSMSCQHKMHAICVVATESDGLALIDQNHELLWLQASEGTRWFDVSCPHSERDRCFAVGSGHSVGVIELNNNIPSNSFVQVKNVQIPGEFTGIHTRDSDHILLQTVPFGWVDWDIMAGDDELGLAYPWLDNADVEDPAIRGERLVGGWADSSETGYAVTSYGRVLKYYPPANSISDNLVSALAPMLVIITVPGVVAGLIYIASPKLQKKYLAWSNARREAKRAARIAKRETKKSRR